VAERNSAALSSGLEKASPSAWSLNRKQNKAGGKQAVINRQSSAISRQIELTTGD
jgi:hypothetical protein